MRTHRHGVLALLSLAIFIVGTAPLFAQLPTATIQGVVRDSDRAVLPGATVTVRNVDTGLTRNAPTDGDGSYRFPALPVGPYEIRVELQGFRTAVRSGVRLVVGQEATLDFTLELGAIQETVTVTADVTLVETTSSSLGAVVTEREIAALPLEGRNYIGLTLMQTGVTESRHTSGAGGGAYPGIWFSSSGAPPRSNAYLLDGSDLRNMAGVSTASVTGQTLGLDGIREYKVLTNAFPAEYGGVMGSQMVMVSKGGSNRFSGTLFQYHRSRALEAANYFDDPDEDVDFSRNNWGGSFGGPIRRDRIHFHGTVEYARVRRGQTNIANTLPLSARTAAAHPAVAPLIVLYPEPNGPNNRYQFTFTEPSSDLYGQGRVDLTLTPSSTLFVRFTVNNGDKVSAAAFPGYETVLETRSRFATVSQNQILSPTVVNTARVSYSHPNHYNLPTYPDVITGARYQFLPGEPMGSINIGGVSGLGPSGPRAFEQRLWSFADDMNMTRGRSAWKFGIQVNRYEQYVQQSSQFGGSVSFGNVAAFLAGTPNFIAAPSLGSFHAKTFNFFSFGVYAQNDWRVTDNLTLNLGLRYEPQTQYKEKFGRESAVRNILTDTEATLGPMLLNNSEKNISPRVGFAWDVTGDGRTAVRGAAAKLYDLANMGTVLVQSVSGTPPFSAFSRINNPGDFSVPFRLPSEAFGRSLRINDYNLGQPTMWHYNVAVERELVRDMSLTVAYAGSRGIDLIRSSEGNPRPPSGTTADGRPFWTGREPRIAPQWDTIELKVADSTSRYNSLQISLNQRLRGGLTFRNSYTLSKAMDEYMGIGNGDFGGGEQQAGPNPFDRSIDWAPSPYDVRHNYRFNLVYRLPDAFEPGSLLGGLLNTWQVSTIIQATTGQPFTPGLATNRSRSGVLGGPSGIDRPDVVPGVNLKDVTKGVSRGCTGIAAGTPVGTPERWFDPCAFTIPPIGTIGNMPRNPLRSPGYSRVDVSFQKMVNTGGTSNIELRVDVFNLFNRVNFSNPNRIVYAARADIEAPLTTAGLITRADAARQAQLSVRLSF